MKKTIIVLIIVCFGISLAQTRADIPINVPILSQGLNNNLYSVYGNSKLLNNVANISSINPAALGNFNKISVGFSYQYQNKLDKAWIASTGSERFKKGIPQSIGFVIPLGEVRFGLSMNQTYNSALVIGPISITTVNNPEGTGESFIPDYRTQIYNFAFSGSYTFPELSNKSKLTIGFRYGINKLEEMEKLLDVGFEESISNNSLSLGVVYTIRNTSEKYLQFGMSYDSGVKFSKMIHFPVVNFASYGSRPGTITSINRSANLNCELPPVLNLNVDISTIDNFKILGNISSLLWKSVSDNESTQFELSGSLVYLLEENITTSFGFYYTDRDYEISEFYDIGNKLRAIYLTAGLGIKVLGIDFQLSIVDGHLLSGDWRKQTIINSNISYSF